MLESEFGFKHACIVQGDAVIVSAVGTHLPDELTQQSGVWIGAAGKALLVEHDHTLAPLTDWTYLIVETGEAVLTFGTQSISLSDGEAVLLPPALNDAMLDCRRDTNIMWLRFCGPLAPLFIKRMGSLLNVLMSQNILPSQIYLSRQIVQVIVRHDNTQDASFQLQQLMWGLLASHSGQPVAMDAMLSHEIAKVVDALRQDQYKTNFSLQDMANISRMPMETFRKRFVAEVGMPPLNYLLYCKMERAKLLLQDRCLVKLAGAEVGMADPYHFSKQFKKIVGLSPMAYKERAERE